MSGISIIWLLLSEFYHIIFFCYTSKLFSIFFVVIVLYNICVLITSLSSYCRM